MNDQHANERRLLDDIMVSPEKYLPEGCPPTPENLTVMARAAFFAYVELPPCPYLTVSA
jgi:hypothetical protein